MLLATRAVQFILVATVAWSLWMIFRMETGRQFLAVDDLSRRRRARRRRTRSS